MKIVIGFVLSFIIGAGCRYFDIPAASPPVIPGALIVLAIAVGPLLVAPSGGVLGAALHLPLCVAITGLGLELWRHSAAESEGSPALPHHEPHPAQA